MQELQKILEEIKESSIIVATSKEHYIHPASCPDCQKEYWIAEVER